MIHDAQVHDSGAKTVVQHQSATGEVQVTAQENFAKESAS